MNFDYDVIVVGAGNGGLSAAAATTKAGLKTLLLEKHNLPGGSASSFRRGRFEFEPSLHELCNMGSEEKPEDIYAVLADYGVKLEWAHEYATFRALNKSGEYDVKLDSGIERFCDGMERAVPGCRQSVREWFAIAEKLNAAMQYVGSKNGKPSKLTMMTKYPEFLICAAHTVDEIEDALGVPKKAQDILNTYWGYLGVPTDELNAMHYMYMTYTYVYNGAVMPRKRSHQLSLSVEKRIRDNGGEVWYNSEVVEFLYDDKKRCVGVKIDDGRKIYAREVISNIIPNRVHEMSAADCVPKRERKLVRARNLGISFYTIYLGLDKTAEELGIADYTVMISDTGDNRSQFNRKDTAYYVVNCLNKVIPDCSPAGTSMLFFTIPVIGEEFPDMKPSEYKRFKNDLAKRFIEDYEQALGIRIMDSIEEISVATPVTFARYLGTPSGEIYGYQNENWDNVCFRTLDFDKDFSVKGLTYCGGHSSYGDGYSCSYITGQQAGKKVVARLNKRG